MPKVRPTSKPKTSRAGTAMANTVGITMSVETARFIQSCSEFQERFANVAIEMRDRRLRREQAAREQQERDAA